MISREYEVQGAIFLYVRILKYIVVKYLDVDYYQNLKLKFNIPIHIFTSKKCKNIVGKYKNKYGNSALTILGYRRFFERIHPHSRRDIKWATSSIQSIPQTCPFHQTYLCTIFDPPYWRASVSPWSSNNSSSILKLKYNIHLIYH